jgi:hypothetical protein
LLFVVNEQGACGREGKTDEAIRLEQLCDDLAKTQQVDILCAYPLSRGQRDHPALKSISAEHTTADSR